MGTYCYYFCAVLVYDSLQRLVTVKEKDSENLDIVPLYDSVSLRSISPPLSLAAITNPNSHSQALCLMNKRLLAQGNPGKELKVQ